MTRSVLNQPVLLPHSGPLLRDNVWTPSNHILITTCILFSALKYTTSDLIHIGMFDHIESSFSRIPVILLSITLFQVRTELFTIVVSRLNKIKAEHIYKNLVGDGKVLQVI